MKPAATNQVEASEISLMQKKPSLEFQQVWRNPRQVRRLTHSLTERDTWLLCSVSLAVRKLFLGQAHVYLLTHPASALLREWSHSVPNQVPSFMEIPRPLPVPLLAVDTVWAASTNLRMPLSRCGNAEIKFPELWHPVSWGQLLTKAPAMKYFCHSFLSLFEDSEFHPHLHTHTHTHTLCLTHTPRHTMPRGPLPILQQGEVWVSSPHHSPMGRDKWPNGTNPELKVKSPSSSTLSSLLRLLCDPRQSLSHSEPISSSGNIH